MKDIKENNYKYELTLIARIEYNGKKYWIKLNENEIAKRNSDNFSYKTEKMADLYDKRTAGRKVLDTIPKNTVFKELYIYEHDQLDTWYYVEYKDQSGWISDSESIMSINHIQETEDPETKIEDEDEKDEKGGKKMTVVIELQKLSDTQIANIVTVYQTRAEAEQKYHAILSAAAVSEVPIHSAIMLEEDGRTIKNEWYNHMVAEA